MSRDLRVAVDGGLDVFHRAGFKPHFAVGDWDSLDPAHAKAALRGVFHLTLPRSKDRSDLYYACRAALAADATDLVCLGVTGGRPDHQLAMLFDLAEIASEAGPGVRVTVVDHEARYIFLSENHRKWEDRLLPGQLVSIFSLGDQVEGVTLKGFKYPLKDAVLKPSSHGLSNEVTKSSCSVQIRKGKLLLISFSDYPQRG